MPARHPFGPQKRSPLAFLASPKFPALVGAASFAALPVARWAPKMEVNLPDTLWVVPKSAYMAVLGCVLGWGTGKGMEWARLRILRALLAYQGWVDAPKAMKTKLWGIALKLFQWPGPHKTLFYQDLLPQQPLPELNASLDRWLIFARQILSEEEYEQTKEAVEEFRDNEGPKLQKFLMEKAEREDSWIADYWMTAAYLASRDSIAINSNYYLTNLLALGRTTDQLARAANFVYNMACAQKLLATDKFPPNLIQDMVPLCMHGFRYCFNSARIPGEHLDSVVRHKGYTHCVVIRKGRYYRMELYLKGEDGQESMLSVEEVYEQLKRIKQMADSEKGEINFVAALTAQRRNVWAKHRELLMQDNPQVVKDIETCLFIVSLDESAPQTYIEHAKHILTGDGHDIWFDKCFTVMFSENGRQLGCNVEHSAVDATVFGMTIEYCLVKEKYVNGDVVRTGRIRTLPKPQKYEWKLNSVAKAIEEAKSAFLEMKDDMDLCVYNCKYGKGAMKKFRVSPDGFLQMVLQLAYHRRYKAWPKTYEPSTGRLYLYGRTETVHVVSDESRAFVEAMDDSSADNKHRIGLLRQAIKGQTEHRLEATVGKGCDRHLLALLCASRENGMDIPRIFMDKAWRMPYMLSTSQTPTRLYDYRCDLEFQGCSGGFGPACREGYGVSYIIMGDDIINIIVTSWSSCEETSSQGFIQEVETAMDDMKAIFQ